LLVITKEYLYLHIHNPQTQKINAMKNQETTQELLDLLLSFNQDQLREELEQLLLSLEDKGSNLESLKGYYQKGGCRQ
jgi:NTP pyrophosphatase (non-canonical NTP hydrolase)